MHQQRLQEVLLVPTSTLPEHPILGVLVGQENVVDMDAHAAREPWKHLEVQVIDVAARLANMRRVDKENVAGLQSLKVSSPTCCTGLLRSRVTPAMPRSRKGRG